MAATFGPPRRCPLHSTAVRVWHVPPTQEAAMQEETHGQPSPTITTHVKGDAVFSNRSMSLAFNAFLAIHLT